MRTEDFLTARGFRQHRERPETRFFQKRIEGPPCHTNDKLFLNVRIFDSIPQIPNWVQTVEIEIVGEYRPGFWAKLQIYSVNEIQLQQQFDELQADLTRAWSAMYQKE